MGKAEEEVNAQEKGGGYVMRGNVGRKKKWEKEAEKCSDCPNGLTTLEFSQLPFSKASHTLQ